jgi:hypothetical protein
VKRERLIQIVLVIVGLLNVAQICFLYMDLWHSSWLLEQKNETHPMFLSFFIPVGVFLLIAARKPSEYRSAIALAAWWHISHGAVMAIQTVEAWIHGVHRNFADVILFLAIGVVLLALLPGKREVVAPAVA